MSLQDRAGSEGHAKGMSTNTRIWLVFAGFALVAGALLFTEHRAHVLGFLVWLPVLACSLMHFFMHGRHGNHHGGGA